MRLKQDLFNDVSIAGRQYAEIARRFMILCEHASSLTNHPYFASAVFTSTPNSLSVEYAGASICLRLVPYIMEDGLVEGRVYVTRTSHSFNGKNAPLGSFSINFRGGTDIENETGRLDLDAAAQLVVLHFIDAALRAPVDTNLSD